MTAAGSGAAMKVFGLMGWSGSGKTTLVVNLLPELLGRGLTVSSMKHTHHAVDIDRPGKDSFRHREAGASEVMLASSARWALLHEVRGEAEPDMEALIGHMSPVDLLLVEGFKTYRHPKMEVHRASVGKALVGDSDPSVHRRRQRRGAGRAAGPGPRPQRHPGHRRLHRGALSAEDGEGRWCSLNATASPRARG